MVPKGMTKGMAAPVDVLVKLAKVAGFVSKEMVIATCAVGWNEEMVMGAPAPVVPIRVSYNGHCSGADGDAPRGKRERGPVVLNPPQKPVPAPCSRQQACWMGGTRYTVTHESQCPRRIHAWWGSRG